MNEAQEERMRRMEHTLFGNGQPGLVVQVAGIKGVLTFLAWIVPLGFAGLGVLVTVYRR